MHNTIIQMKIAIEAQRIFRINKHGMDFVALETIRELSKRVSQLSHLRDKMPLLSFMGTSSPTYGNKEDKTRYTTLYK